MPQYMYIGLTQKESRLIYDEAAWSRKASFCITRLANVARFHRASMINDMIGIARSSMCK